MYDEFDQLLSDDLFEEIPKTETLKLKDGERRIVSILFADLKGFTAMSEKMDPEVVGSILDRILQLFTKCIKQFGGFIDKYEGDLVMALFGAKQASEHDTERAVNAAIKMIDLLQPINQLLDKKYPQGKGLDLAVRIGINTGLVTTGKVGEKREGDFTVYGNVVNLASRMESNAPVNRIMLPEGTKKTIEQLFEFEDHGEILVKGKSEPISVFLVKRLKAKTTQRWQLKETAHVGRDEELKILSGKYEIVQNRISDKMLKDTDKKPVLIGIKGEAGIGKSRLIYEFLKANNCFYLQGSTSSIAQNPYCVFTSMIKEYLNISQIDSRQQAKLKLENGFKDLKTRLNKNEKNNLDSVLPMIGYLLNIKYEDIRFKLKPDELLTHLQTAIRFFLEATSVKANQVNKPLVVIWEDLHWADELSTDTINFLMQTLNLEKRRENRKLHQFLFILLYRPEYKLPEEIGYKTDLKKIVLKPLQDPDTDNLITSMAGKKDLSERVKLELMQKSAGNPFYIEEWMQLIKDMPETEELPIPDSLNALILTRIDNLDKNIKLLLQKASVIGKEFPEKILIEIEKKLNNSQQISDHLKFLETNAFVVKNLKTEYSSYFFKHILIQEVAYKTMLIANRRTLHRITAEVIEEHFIETIEEHYYDLAYHFEQAEVADKAIEYLEKAGDNARENYENINAINCYNRLLKIATDELKITDLNHSQHLIVKHLLIETLLKIGHIHLLIGKWSDAIEFFKNALKLSKEIEEKEWIAKSIFSVGLQYSLQGRYEKAIECYQKQLIICEEIGDKRGISTSAGNLGDVYRYQGNYGKAMECYQKQLIINEDICYKNGISTTFGGMGNVYWNQGNYEKAMECYQKQLIINEEIGYKREIGIAVGHMGNIYWNQGNYGKAMECYEKQLIINEEIGYKRGIGMAVGNMGNVYSDQGNYEKAMGCYEEQLIINEEIGNNRGIGIAVVNMGTVYSDQGNYEKAMGCYEKSLKSFEEIGYKAGISSVVGNMGAVYSDQGNYEKAMECSEKSLKSFEEIGDKGGIAFAVGAMGDIYRVKGSYGKSMECYKNQLKICEELGDKSGISFIMGNMGIACKDEGNLKLAIEYFNRSMQICIEIGNKLVLADKLILKADIYLIEKKYKEAIEICDEGLMMAKEIADLKSIFNGRILKNKLISVQDKESGILSLESMLNDYKEESQIADINFELFKLAGYKKYKNRAVEIYRKLYEKTPKIDYKNKIDELEWT